MAKHTTHSFWKLLERFLRQMGEKLKKKAGYNSLKSQLENLERQGIKLYLNGAPSNTDSIVKNCIREDTIYMPDYVTDENGEIREIRYDKISHM